MLVDIRVGLSHILCRNAIINILQNRLGDNLLIEVFLPREDCRYVGTVEAVLKADGFLTAIRLPAVLKIKGKRGFYSLFDGFADGIDGSCPERLADVVSEKCILFRVVVNAVHPADKASVIKLQAVKNRAVGNGFTCEGDAGNDALLPYFRIAVNSRVLDIAALADGGATADIAVTDGEISWRKITADCRRPVEEAILIHSVGHEMPKLSRRSEMDERRRRKPYKLHIIAGKGLPECSSAVVKLRGEIALRLLFIKLLES